MIFVAFGIADYRLFVSSRALGIGYAVCLPLVFLNMFYFYCRKCPHVADKTCRHVLFGPIVKKLFKPVNPAPYKTGEIIIALVPMAIFILFPQRWLFKTLYLFVMYWVLMLMAGAIIRFRVCPKCGNINCPLCPNKAESNGRHSR